MRRKSACSSALATNNRKHLLAAAPGSELGAIAELWLRFTAERPSTNARACGLRGLPQAFKLKWRLPSTSPTVRGTWKFALACVAELRHKLRRIFHYLIKGREIVSLFSLALEARTHTRARAHANSFSLFHQIAVYNTLAPARARAFARFQCRP